MRLLRATLVLAVASMFATAAARAAEIEVIGTTIKVSGHMDNTDAAKFAAVLNANPKTQAVLFEECLGGSYFSGRAISLLIRERKLNTQAKRRCFSACATAFLGGVERSFASGFGISAIGFHAGKFLDARGTPDEKTLRKVAAHDVMLTGGKMPPELVDAIVHSTAKGAAVMFMRRDFGMFSRDAVLRCTGEELRMELCPRMATNEDALSAGVITRK